MTILYSRINMTKISPYLLRVTLLIQGTYNPIYIPSFSTFVYGYKENAGDVPKKDVTQ